MATTLELIGMLRELLDDEAHPYLWANSYLLRGLNQGEEQIARRAYVLIDGDTASVCCFSINVSQASYSLHSRVLQVRELRIGSADIPLSQKYRDELNEQYPGWWSAYGTPEHYIVEKTGEITLHPIPQSADVASFVVARLPLNSLALSGETYPEIPGMYHEEMIIWGLRHAYLKPGEDTFNKALSDSYEQEFTAKIGPLPSVLEERRRKTWPRNMSARPREFGT